MNKIIISLTTLAACCSFAGVAVAKPINAAEVETPGDRDGIGCLVHASETDAFLPDMSCRSQLVVKRDRSGAVVSFRYHDHGELQLGQTAPDRALRIPVVGLAIYGLPCDGHEIISPSGGYSSSVVCR